MVLGKLYTMMTKPVPVTLISLKMRQLYEASKAITVARTAMRTTPTVEIFETRQKLEGPNKSDSSEHGDPRDPIPCDW